MSELAAAGEPLPAGARVLHIGPPKTGTTAVQAAFHAARRAATAQGVHYAGRVEHELQAVHAAIGRPYLGAVPSGLRWTRLRWEIKRSTAGRVLLSSEALAYAEPEAIRRLVAELDPARVQVVVTLRPLARIVPAQWKQGLQSGTTAGYPGWLEALFADPPGAMASTFWWMHRHDELVARWAAEVGGSRVTVVVADDSEPTFLLRAFEGLLGLRPDTLVSVPTAGNRSLTQPEADALRGFNLALRARGLEGDQGARLVRMTGSQLMKLRVPEPGEPAVATPGWAADRLAAVQAEVVAGLVASGVRVVGTLGSLESPTRDPEVPRSAAPETEPAGDRVPAELAGAVALDLLIASGAVPPGSVAAATTDDSSLHRRLVRPDLRSYSMAGLVRVLGRRLWRAVGRRVG